MAKAPKRIRQQQPRSGGQETLAGIHAVSEAIRAGRRQIHAVHVAVGRQDRRILEVTALADAAGIGVRALPDSELDRMAGTTRHQGCCANVSAYPVASVEALIASMDGAPPLILVLDQVVDPHNLGALVRSAEVAGVSGVVIPRDRSAGPTPDVSRISVGALEHIQLAAVVNLSRTLDQCRKAGIWTVGLDASARTTIFDVDFTVPTAVVVGSEASGIRPLVRKQCDLVATIPMAGRVTSLNASVAGAVSLFEAIRQRRAATPHGKPKNDNH